MYVRPGFRIRLLVILYFVYFRLSYSQQYLVVRLSGLELPLMVTIRVSRVSDMISVRVSIK